MRKIKIIYPEITQSKEEILQELRDFFSDKREVEDLIFILRKIKGSNLTIKS